MNFLSERKQEKTRYTKPKVKITYVTLNSKAKPHLNPNPNPEKPQLFKSYCPAVLSVVGVTYEETFSLYHPPSLLFATDLGPLHVA